MSTATPSMTRSTSPPSAATPVIQVRDFSLESLREPQPHDLQRQESDTYMIAERLYERCELSAYHGEIVLILGASGAGKSLLTHYLLNIVSPLTETLMINQGQARPSPSITLNLSAHEPVELMSAPYPHELTGKIGVMFQSLGLLEDLTVYDNLRFANDHSAHPKRDLEWRGWLDDILRDLKLRASILYEPVSKLSGGERQRVALGRLLAYAPDVMIFDEPTSALDPRSAKQVVTLIAEAHTRSQAALTLIVTHDYTHFQEIADRIWFLNQAREFLEDAPPKRAIDYQRQLEVPRVPACRPLDVDTVMRHQAVIRDQRLLTRPRAWITQLSRGIKSVRSPWFVYYLRQFLRRVCLRGMRFHCLSGLILGGVATYFSLSLKLGSVPTHVGDSVQISELMVPTFFEQMLKGFSVVMYRATIPLFTCLCIAARAGTAVTAYLSEMRDEGKRQWDAIESFGLSARWFFTPQLIITFSLSCLVLSYLSFLFASLGSLITAMLTNPLCTFYSWRDSYWAALEARWGLYFAGTEILIAKTMISGALIGCISSYYGARRRQTTQETMGNLSGANVMSVYAVLVVFFCLLVLESR